MTKKELETKVESLSKELSQLAERVGTLERGATTDSNTSPKVESKPVESIFPPPLR